MTRESFETEADAYLRTHPDLEPIPPSQRVTASDVAAWCHEHTSVPSRSLLDLASADLPPLRTETASYFQRMADALTAVRERSLDREIATALSTHDRVLVVYGSGHLVKSRPVFEYAFDKVTQFRLR